MKHATALYLLTAGAALAHGGHPEAVTHGDAHWLTAGDHVIVLGLSLIAVFLGVRKALSKRRRQARS